MTRQKKQVRIRHPKDGRILMPPEEVEFFAFRLRKIAGAFKSNGVSYTRQAGTNGNQRYFAGSDATR